MSFRVTQSVVASLVLALLTACGPQEGFEDFEGEEEIVETSDGISANDRYIVKFKDGVVRSSSFNALSSVGAQVYRTLEPQNAVAARMSSSQVMKLLKDSSVAFIERDPIRKPLAQSRPYGIDLSRIPEVWASTTGGNRTVCIIDSGLYLNHEDIQKTNVTGTSGQSWNTDGCGHGTHVAGTIAALNNDVGVVGVNPNGVKLHIYKLFNDSCQAGFGSSLVAAVNDCVAAGANVISMSLGGGAASVTEEQAYIDATNKGVLVIAAAGNSGNTAYSYPASYPIVMSVAALDETKTVADFSQKNDQVDIAAAGVNVASTIPWEDRAKLTVGGVTYAAVGIDGSQKTDGAGKTGALVDGGICDKSDAAWSGKVVLCQRGTVTFADKLKNVLAGKGVAAVVYNNAPGGFMGSTGGTAVALPGVGISQEDGKVLLGKLNASTNVVNQQVKPASGYGAWSGTSMATPHVSGIAALIWSANPLWSPKQIRTAMERTAVDLGTAGRDNAYGYGLVDAKAAFDYLKSGKANTAPKVDYTVACQNLTCSFTDQSADADGQIVRYGWTFGDGTPSSTYRSVTHTFPAAGSYSVRHTATDNQGKTGYKTKTITVTSDGSNVRPTASFSYSCSGLTCSFKDASWDPDGRVTSWSWKFGKAGTSTAQNPSFTFPGPGRYYVTLRATDDRGGYKTSTRAVTLTIKLSGSIMGFGSWVTIASLQWENSKTDAQIDIYKNGTKFKTVANEGTYEDQMWGVASGTFTYKVCQAGSTTICSNTVTLTR